jgi:hypothetical protein
MDMPDLTVTSPPTNQFYGVGNPEEIIPRGRYVDHYVEATLASGYVQPPRSQKLSEDSVLAQLGPLERWLYLARYSQGEFIIYLIALFGGVYLLVMAGIHLGVNIFSSASAQNMPGVFTGSSRDAFDWYVAALMGIALLCSLGMIMLAQKESKISFGKDTTKMILGFVVGFLSGGKTR